MSVALWQYLFNALGPWLWIALGLAYLLVQLRSDRDGKSLFIMAAIAAATGFLLARDMTVPAPPLVNRAQFGVDALLLAALVVLSLRSGPLHPVVIAAAQLLAVMIDAMALLGLAMLPITHLAMLGGLAFVQGCAFGYGLIRYRNRRPLWRRRVRVENAALELAPHANRAR